MNTSNYSSHAQAKAPARTVQRSITQREIAIGRRPPQSGPRQVNQGAGKPIEWNRAQWHDGAD